MIFEDLSDEPTKSIINAGHIARFIPEFVCEFLSNFIGLKHFNNFLTHVHIYEVGSSCGFKQMKIVISVNPNVFGVLVCKCFTQVISFSWTIFEEFPILVMKLCCGWTFYTAKFPCARLGFEFCCENTILIVVIFCRFKPRTWR